MIRMPIDTIINKIKEHTGLSEDSIKDQIKVKMRQLEGLVSEEGAAYIVASDSGVRLFKDTSGPGAIKIKDILPGMHSVEAVGKVTRIFPVVTFTAKDKTESQVVALTINDGTGFSRVVIWDHRVDWVKEGRITEGLILKIKDGFVKEGKFGGKEIHINKRSSLIINPKGVKIDAELPVESSSKNINELQEGDATNILATIVQVFPPKFYPRCPECNKKAINMPEGLKCPNHKDAEPIQTMILNFVLDDGKDTIRAVAFRDEAEHLSGATTKELEDSFIKDGEMIVRDKLNSKLLGKTIEVNARVVKNKAFDRLELRATRSNLSPSAKAIATRLLGKQ